MSLTPPPWSLPDTYELANRRHAASTGGATVPGIRGKLRLLPDGSIKGCSHIYAPQGQAGEYAPLACNPYRGCGFGCLYCYVPNVLKMKRPDFNAGAAPRKGFSRAGLTREAKKYQALGLDGQVMLSFTSDPFNPFDQSLTRPTIEILREHGMAFCTLTKGGTAALPYLDLYRPEKDAFASTLTSLEDDFSRKWEPRAALPADRIAALRAFHEANVYTWVSLEPTLSTEASLEIVRELHGIVDLWKIGRANYLGSVTTTTDWEGYTLRMMDLLGDLGAAHYFKRDLQGYLPEGYHNPLRVPQHRPARKP